MYVKALLAVAAGLLSTVSALNATEADLEIRQEERCASGAHIIALGGLKTTQGDLGLLASLAYGLRDSIPGSTLSQIAYSPGADGPTAIAEGVNALNSHIREYSAGCPRSKIVVAGYSVGATVAMNVFCGAYTTGEGALPNSYRKNILANVVYGDLTFIPTPRYTEGTCQTPSIRPRAKPGACFPFGKKTRSYCDTNDPECCAGGDTNVHFSYPKYDQDAIGWVVRRYQRSQG